MTMETVAALPPAFLVGAMDRADDTRLSAYSRTRPPSIWQTEAFSNWFLHVLLTSLRDRT
jgi:hypothetical protein